MRQGWLLEARRPHLAPGFRLTLDTPLDPKCGWIFSVPNTAYIDFTYSLLEEALPKLVTFLWGMATSGASIWRNDGLKVVLTDSRLTHLQIIHHMQDPN